MGLPKLETTVKRGFRPMWRRLTSVIGHADRAKPLRDYWV